MIQELWLKCLSVYSKKSNGIFGKVHIIADLESYHLEADDINDPKKWEGTFRIYHGNGHCVDVTKRILSMRTLNAEYLYYDEYDGFNRIPNGLMLEQLNKYCD